MTPELHNLLCATRNFIDAHDLGHIQLTEDCIPVINLCKSLAEYEDPSCTLRPHDMQIFNEPKDVVFLRREIGAVIRSMWDNKLCTIPKKSVLIEKLRAQLDRCITCSTN